MPSLIIYDSFFGNTEKIALAISDALGDAQVCKVNSVTPAQIQAADMVVVGSPTRGFRPSKPIQELLKTIPVQGKRVAAFDTRIPVKEVNNLILTILVKIFGYAAEPIAKGLQQQGGKLVAPAQGFIVNESEGPLRDGELERAADWAKQLAAA